MFIKHHLNICIRIFLIVFLNFLILIYHSFRCNYFNSFLLFWRIAHLKFIFMSYSIILITKSHLNNHIQWNSYVHSKITFDIHFTSYSSEYWLEVIPDYSSIVYMNRHLGSFLCLRVSLVFKVYLGFIARRRIVDGLVGWRMIFGRGRIHLG